MSSVTSTANLADFKVRKTNVGVDVSVFQAAEVVCDTLVANNLDVADATGIVDLEGTVGINVDVAPLGTQGITTIAGAPGVAQTVYIGGNNGTTYGANTGVKTINIGTAAAANVVTVGSSTGAASVSLVSGTGGISVPNQRTSVNLTTAGLAVVLTKADSGKVQVINADSASYTFSSTAGVAPVAGCVYRFVSNLAAPGTVTINCATNIAATYQGAVLACDTDTANTIVIGTSTANTIITLTTANGKVGSWVELVFTSDTTINVTGTIFGVTPANVFSG